MSINTVELFKQQLAGELNMVTVNHFEGLVTAKVSGAAPPSDMQVVNTEDYRKVFNQNPVLYWGDKNTFPTLIDEEAQGSSVFEGAMKILADHLRGQDLFLYNYDYVDGKRVVVEVQDQEVMDELEDIGYFEYWHDACGELPKWGNLWPLFGMNANRDIRSIRVNDGSWNRFERPQPSNGKIENIYISAQWANSNFAQRITKGVIPKELKGWVQKYPLLSRLNYLDELESNVMKKYSTFAAHIKYHTTGSVYGRAPWHSLYKNRWLGISGKVPEMMIRYYEAAMTINYLIYINTDWLLKKYPDMDTWDEGTRAEKIKEIQQGYDKNLKGTDNAFKSLMLAFKYNQTGDEEKNVKFELLDNKMREGTFIPDSQISDGQILFTLGISPSLIGAVIPGSKGGESGSGSNIREASLALQMRLRPDQELINNAFYIWRDYKFRGAAAREKKKLMIGVRGYVIDTLDARAPKASSETTQKN